MENGEKGRKRYLMYFWINPNYKRKTETKNTWKQQVTDA